MSAAAEPKVRGELAPDSPDPRVAIENDRVVDADAVGALHGENHLALGGQIDERLGVENPARHRLGASHLAAVAIGGERVGRHVNAGIRRPTSGPGARALGVEHATPVRRHAVPERPGETDVAQAAVTIGRRVGGADLRRFECLLRPPADELAARPPPDRAGVRDRVFDGGASLLPKVRRRSARDPSSGWSRTTR